MKTANVRQLRHDCGEVMHWITEGEQVQIIKKGQVVALLSPPPAIPSKKRTRLPDFKSRQKIIFGDRVLGSGIVEEEREGYEW
jgi:antitoxin (DNA-binding transcriptional repressor) of toxin-antitoxin stability system